MDYLKKLKRFLRKLLEDNEQLTKEGEESVLTKPFVLNVYNIENLNMNNKNDHSTNYGARVEGSIYGDVKDSLNTNNKIKSEPVDKAELANRLTALNQIVEKLITQLPAQDASRASRALNTLKEEAVSDAPNKEWYEISAKGLLQAAKTVASMTEPVTSAVKAVLDLLAG